MAPAALVNTISLTNAARPPDPRTKGPSAMSVTRTHGAKVVLPRRDPDRFWGSLRRAYAEEDVRRWKALAMLTLTEAAGWPPDRVALAFGLTPRQVNRGNGDTRRRLARRFRPETPAEEGARAADRDDPPADA